MRARRRWVAAVSCILAALGPLRPSAGEEPPAAPPSEAPGDARAAAPADAKPAEANPANQDALFQKVFGQKRQNKPRQLDLPVRLDNNELGLVPARIGASAADARLEMRRLAEILRGRVQDTVLDKVLAAAGPDGYGDPAAVPADALKLAIDQNDLQVVVEVPAVNFTRVQLDVLGRTRPQNYMALPNANVSAYTNIRASMEYLARPSGLVTTSEGRQPMSLAIENAINIRGWVIEAEAFYHEGGPQRWGRGAVRLVKDFVADRLRLQVGDINYPVSSVQSGTPLGGIVLARNFTLQPYRTSQPSGQRDFVLEAPSVVEVMVNGRPARSFRLQPGPYSLADFPGTAGTNDIQVRITDVYGRERSISFPFFFDNQLLDEGLHEYSYAMGFPSTVDRDRYHYDRDRPTFSGFHRVGVSENVTLGASIQADHRQQIFGTEILFASPLGTIVLEPAMSKTYGVKGYQVTARYRDFRNGAQFWQQRTITAQATWKDSVFASFGSLTPNNDVTWDASVRVGQPITNNLVATLAGRVQIVRDPTLGNGHSIDFSLRQRLGRTGSFDVTVTKGRDTDGKQEIGIFASVRFNFLEGRFSADSSIDTIERQRRLDLRYQDFHPVDAFNLTLGLVNQPNNNQLNGSATYTHQRFEASLRHDLTRTPLESGGFGLDNRSTANFGTAFAYADGHVGVTRPISNSFAMVVPHPRLKNLSVGVDPSTTGHYLSETDILGPPVVPNITAYFVRPLLVTVPDAPVTYDIGNDRPMVTPGYRTGTLVPIGTDATVSLSGDITLEDGSPVSLQSGELRPAGDANGRVAIPFFTNRRGHYRVEAVRPGKWILMVFGHDGQEREVEVAPEADGVLQIPVFILKGRAPQVEGAEPAAPKTVGALPQ